ncbi:MAG: hypothetical protein RR272_00830 [Synergistaceae bacterium]
MDINKDKFKKILKSLCVPIFVIIIVLTIHYIPTPNVKGDINIRTIRPAHFPIILALEHRDGQIDSAWIRTPAGVREIPDVIGTSFIGDRTYISDIDDDNQKDLMWRLSFMNFEGEGIHLWIGMVTENPQIFIATTPYEFTRWDALPAKLSVPKDTAVYIAPTSPGYMGKKKYSGVESYTFVYTMKMTENGLSFVPVPSVYNQLATLLKTGMRGETVKEKRIENIQLLTEFNSLANAAPPSTEALLNMQIKKQNTLYWKK